MADSNYHNNPTLEERYGSMYDFFNATSAQHGALDADTLIKYWNWGKKPNMSVSSLALMAGVTWTTMDKWLDRIHKEANVERPRPKRKSV